MNKIIIAMILVCMTLLSSVRALTVGGFDSSFFNGVIDEVYLFTRSLQVGQLANLYNNDTNVLNFNETLLADNVSACVTANDAYVDGNTLCTPDLQIEEAGNISISLTNPNLNFSGALRVLKESSHIQVTNDGNLAIDVGLCANQSLFPNEGFNSVTFQANLTIPSGITYTASQNVTNITSCASPTNLITGLSSGAGQNFNVSVLVNADNVNNAGTYLSTLSFIASWAS